MEHRHSPRGDSDVSALSRRLVGYSGVIKLSRIDRVPAQFRRRSPNMEMPYFRKFYREAHSVTTISTRERILIGLAVAMTRNCEA